MSIATLVWLSTFLFVFCEFGERVSEAFEESYDVIGQLDWYAFPMNLQKMLHIIIISVQEPVTLKSFGNIPCAREQAKRVFNGGFSFYTALRKLKD